MSTFSLSAQALHSFVMTSLAPGTQWSQKATRSWPAACAPCTKGLAATAVAAAAAAVPSTRRRVIVLLVILTPHAQLFDGRGRRNSPALPGAVRKRAKKRPVTGMRPRVAAVAPLVARFSPG